MAPAPEEQPSGGHSGAGAALVWLAVIAMATSAGGCGDDPAYTPPRGGFLDPDCGDLLRASDREAGWDRREACHHGSGNGTPLIQI